MKNKADRKIELAWYRLANGVQVDIMDIPEIFVEARLALDRGEDLDQVIIGLIAKYRKN